ncbi:MAG: YigZ family protein [Candidatus Krumholzibacteriia bacterium]
MDPSPDSYLTLAGPAESEERIQRSRFIAVAAPAADGEAAQALVDAVRRRFHDARHVCHAWRVGGPGGPGELRQDDGEPSGTAGEPILLAIRGAGLTNTVVAVARYFGGVKLGTGGLTRAYGGVAAAALAAAPRREVPLGRRFRLDHDYAHQKTVEHLLAAHRGHLEHVVYDTAVHSRLWLPNSTWQAFADALEHASRGRLTLGLLDDESPA